MHCFVIKGETSALLGISPRSQILHKIINNIMDAIKKKMQAMKIEKDNAMDKADMCERSCKVGELIMIIR